MAASLLLLLPNVAEHRSLLVVYVFSLFQTFRVVPHGTKGTGPGFVTRPVYLRSQFRNNTNTVSTLVLLIHLLQVLCTWYAGNAHHRALQTSGRGWADSKAVHGMECSRPHSLCWRSLSQQGLLPVVYRTASTGRCAHLHDRTIDKEQTKNQRPRVLYPGGIYSWGRSASSANGSRSHDCAPVTWAYGIPYPALVVYI